MTENKLQTIKTIALSATAATMFSFMPADSGTWKSDSIHSNLTFSVVHFGISDVDGSFKKFEATFTSSKEDFTDAVFEFTGDVTSISTDNVQRDEHLKSPDFFDAAKFSAIIFKSTSVKKIADKKYKISGELTMHGITKPVDLDATIASGINLRSKKPLVGVRIIGALSRSAFGIGSSVPAAMVSDEVTIKGSAEFGKE